MNNCKDCHYYRKIKGFGEPFKICHYSLDTGKLRKCSPEDCKVKKKAEKYLHKPLTIKKN